MHNDGSNARHKGALPMFIRQGTKGEALLAQQSRDMGKAKLALPCLFRKGETLPPTPRQKKSACADRLTVLSLLFLALTFLWLVLAPCSIEVQRLFFAWRVRSYNAVAAEKARQDLQQRLSHDPPLGITVESLQGKQPCNGVLVSPDLPLLLVVMGDCKGCKAGNVKVWQEVAGSTTWRQRLQVAVLFQNGEEEIAQEARARGWALPIFADPKGEITQALNAQFTPRAYGFVKGRLVWKQDEPTEGEVSALQQFAEHLWGQQKANRLLTAWARELRQQAWGNDRRRG